MMIVLLWYVQLVSDTSRWCGGLYILLNPIESLFPDQT